MGVGGRNAECARGFPIPCGLSEDSGAPTAALIPAGLGSTQPRTLRAACFSCQWLPRPMGPTYYPTLALTCLATLPAL